MLEDRRLKNGKYLAGDWKDGSGRFLISFESEDFPYSIEDAAWIREHAANILIEYWETDVLVKTHVY